MLFRALADAGSASIIEKANVGLSMRDKSNLNIYIELNIIGSRLMACGYVNAGAASFRYACFNYKTIQSVSYYQLEVNGS